MPLDVLTRARPFNADTVADWLVHDATAMQGIDGLACGFAEALVHAGLPVDRLTIGVPILLPHIAGMQVRWYRGRGTDHQEFPATAETLRQMEASPVRA